MPTTSAVAIVFLVLSIALILTAVAWGGWAMWKLVTTEDVPPVDDDATVPVGLVEILERHRQHPPRPVMPWHQRVGPDGGDTGDALARDLWTRRN
ncbi:MAG: hypothetical protein AAF791_07945 [Bacteroidota bacterium]